MKSLILLTALITFAVSQECGPDELKGCLTEFQKLIDPKGIYLTYNNVLESCKVRRDTMHCLETFTKQCSSLTEDLKESIERTRDYVGKICRWRSDFKADVKSNEECYQNVTERFSACYGEESELIDELSVQSGWEAECSEYKVLKHCAIKHAQNVCGLKTSQIVKDLVIKIHGAVLDVACKNTVNIMIQTEEYSFNEKTRSTAETSSATSHVPLTQTETLESSTSETFPASKTSKSTQLTSVMSTSLPDTTISTVSESSEETKPVYNETTPGTAETTVILNVTTTTEVSTEIEPTRLPSSSSSIVALSLSAVFLFLFSILF